MKEQTETVELTAIKESKSSFAERYPITTQTIVNVLILVVLLVTVNYVRNSAFEAGIQIGRAQSSMACTEVILESLEARKPNTLVLPTPPPASGKAF